jgi:hypothetical protein
MITFLELTEILKYDSDELDQKTFTIYERWIICQERSLLANKEDKRKSYLSDKTKENCIKILDLINKSNWSRTIEITIY